jgi:DNA mismatch endonuclease (patch repair protein)
MDKISKAIRSKNMSKIRSTDTKPEKYIRLLLFHLGFRYRINYKKVIGKPDIYINRYKVAIFINGCFWHRHNGCKYTYNPKTNVEFWNEKFKKNVERDRKVYNTLSSQGIKILVIWECTIEKMMKDELFKANTLRLLSEDISNGICGKFEF